MSIQSEVGIKTKDQLKQTMQESLQKQASDIDLSVGGALRDVVEVELLLRAKDQQLLSKTIAQTSWKTATGAALERMASERGLTRKKAVKEVWTIRCGKSNTNQQATINKGARIQVEGSNPPVYFLAQTQTTFTNAYQQDVSFEAEFAGVKTISIGAIKTIVSGLQGIEWVRNITLTQSGRDAESDDSLRSRIQGYYSSLSNNLSESGWVARAKQQSFVRDVTVMANTPNRGDLDFYFTARPGAGVPTAAQVATLQTELKKYALFEEIRTHAATATTVNLNLIVLLQKGDANTLKPLLEAYIKSLFAHYTASGQGSRLYHLGMSLNRLVLGSKVIQFLETKQAEVSNLYWNAPKADVSVDKVILQLGTLQVGLYSSLSAFSQAKQ